MPVPEENPSKLKHWSARENDRLSLVLMAVAILCLGGFSAYTEWKISGRALGAVSVGLVALAGLICLGMAWGQASVHAGRRGPTHRVLVWLGALSLLAIIVVNEFIPHGPRGSLWPLILASAACVYLWWLASLIFDLVFVWHRYIQGDAAMNFLRKNLRSNGPERGPDPGGSEAPFEPTPPPPTPSLARFPVRFRKEVKRPIATE